MKNHRWLVCLGIAGGIIVGGCFGPPVLAVRYSEAVPKVFARLLGQARDATETLLRGDPASRREAAEDADSTFRVLAALACEAPESRELLDSLQKAVRTEREDWIASRLLQNLENLGTDCLNQLYFQALKSRSPNLRWRAVQWFSEHEDPEALPYLEQAMMLEKRPWVRIDLLAALAENHATGVASELLDVAETGSPSLSRAAFRAIESLGDRGVVPDLARLARTGETPVRAGAVSTLASWADSVVALTAILDATGDEEPAVRGPAIESLGRFADARAVRKALDLAGSGNRLEDRAAALRALGELRPPEAVPVLADLLHESLPEAGSSLREDAVELLMDLDDPAAIPLLHDLDPAAEGTGSSDLQQLLDCLTRDRTQGTCRRTRIRVSCGEDAEEEDPENPRLFRVDPPAGRITIRCWEFPGVAGDPEDFERLPGGSEAELEDHFEGEDDSWVQVDDSESLEDCWVPMRLLRPLRGDDVPEDPVGKAGLREFDLPEEELSSEAARDLTEAGLLKVIEPGEEVVGLSLEVKPGDEESIALLQRSCGIEDSLLAREIQRALETVGGRPAARCGAASDEDVEGGREQDAASERGPF